MLDPLPSPLTTSCMYFPEGFSLPSCLTFSVVRYSLQSLWTLFLLYLPLSVLYTSNLLPESFISLALLLFIITVLTLYISLWNFVPLQCKKKNSFVPVSFSFRMPTLCHSLCFLWMFFYLGRYYRYPLFSFWLFLYLTYIFFQLVIYCIIFSLFFLSDVCFTCILSFLFSLLDIDYIVSSHFSFCMFTVF